MDIIIIETRLLTALGGVDAIAPYFPEYNLILITSNSVYKNGANIPLGNATGLTAYRLSRKPVPAAAESETDAV